MATSQTYYLNGASLGSSTSIFINPELTILGADGFYSDGVIVREQSGGILLPQQPCPSCATQCGESVITSFDSNGVYMLPIDAGSSVGAIIIRFNPFSIPIGIQAVFNSITYNKLVSATYGVLEGSPGLLTYVGNTANDCGLVAGSPHTLDDFVFNGTSFVPQATQSIVSITAPEVQTTVASPGECVMIIPKTTASPSAVDVTIAAACASAVFNVKIECPAFLSSFEISEANVDAPAACLSSVSTDAYVAFINGSGTVFGLYDCIFSDATGEFPLPDGYYKTNLISVPPGYDWMRLQNGVIIEFGNCP
ncbi:MAG: hypothetical protein [Podoviridae sp. ctrTa16]|nr:MAG: hypothetical protein [Podoviridae sp. ctrTa16]